MRHSVIGAIGSVASIRFHHIQACTWIAATLAGLTGCVQAASVLGEAGTGKLRFRATSLQEHPSGWLTDTSAHGPSASEVETAAPASNFEDYWTAVADLDFATLRTVARSEPEIGFLDGLFSLAGGNQSKAESAFTSGRQLEEINLAVASQMMLAATLLYERKWVKLRDLAIGATFEVVDRANTIELERWGRAFATADQQETILPRVPVSLPLRMTSLGTPTVRVRINGKEYDFWIDTGSGITVLSSDVAAEANVPSTSTDTLRVRTFAGTVSVRPAMVKRMEIGPIVFINSPAVVIEASQMLLRSAGEGPPQAGVHVDGIIGWDTIRQLDVVLDYQDKTITISRPDIPDTNGAASQNLKWVGRPLVEVRTKTGKVLHFTLDTGAQASFLNASVLERAGITARNYDARVFGLGSTGASTNKIVPTLTLAVAGRSLHLERVFVYGPAWSGIINCDGIFGSDIGQFGQIRIDATNGVFSVGD